MFLPVLGPTTKTDSQAHRLPQSHCPWDVLKPESKSDVIPAGCPVQEIIQQR